MEGDKIVLDRRSFEALAVGTRVRLLKALQERRKMLTELADELGLSVSGTKEHLETLERVGLVRKIDDGHKWKYYELTQKGSSIVRPGELKVWILLSTSAIAFVSFFLLYVFMQMNVGAASPFMQAASPAYKPALGLPGAEGAMAAAAAAGTDSNESITAKSLPMAAAAPPAGTADSFGNAGARESALTTAAGSEPVVSGDDMRSTLILLMGFSGTVIFLSVGLLWWGRRSRKQALGAQANV